MKDDILAKAAILQRDEESYAIMAPLMGGVMDIPTARRIADVAKTFGVTTLKITGAQRLALLGIQEKDIDAAHAALGSKAPLVGSALCQQYVKVCPGNSFCTRGQRDTLSFATKFVERFHPFPKILAKVKIGIAGCYNSCVEPAIKDLGLIGLPQGWLLMAVERGQRADARPSHRQKHERRPGSGPSRGHPEVLSRGCVETPDEKHEIGRHYEKGGSGAISRGVGLGRLKLISSP